MKNSKKDINKPDLYESVKQLVESEEKHVHLPQQKLFTLFSIAFQYMLYRSTKIPGAYIIRIEDSTLAEKLARKSKDPSTRKFIQSLLLPRKLKYQKSTFLLDFFHVGSWSLTSEIGPEKIKGAIIIKNTSDKPMTELLEEEEADETDPNFGLPENYYLASLLEFVPKTVTIAYDKDFSEFDLKTIKFDFIKQDREKIAGLTLSENINIDDTD